MQEVTDPALNNRPDTVVHPTTLARVRRFCAREDLRDKRLMLYSAGRLTRHLLATGVFAGLRIEAIIDRDLGADRDAELAAFRVIHPERLEVERPDVVAILSTRFHDSIYLGLLPECGRLGVELIDLCGEHPEYRRFPDVRADSFPAGSLVLSDFLVIDGIRFFDSVEELRKAHPGASEVIVCFESDAALAGTARRLMDCSIRYYGFPDARGTSHDASYLFEAPQGRCPHVMFKDDQVRRAIIAARQHCARKDICSHFDVRDFGNLLQFIRETRSLPGDYVEIGVYKGTSAAVVATYLEFTGDRREMWLFDTYEGFSYPMARTSADAVWQGTHGETSLEFVTEVVASTGRKPRVHQLDICADALPEELRSISVANIDVDLYEAVRDALRKVAPRVVQHGVIVCEDYGHTPELAGANLAVNEFAESCGEAFAKLYFESGQMCFIKR